jgi:ABC-type nitrate/sulfonate/bicarbonate transport system substrate-binding protein
VQTVRESHFDHGQPNSFRQGGNIPPIWARSRGSDVRLIGLSRVEYFQAVLSMPDSGITRPADLKGKRLALPRRINDQIDFQRAGTLRGFRAALREGGLSERDVEFVDLEIAEPYIVPEDDAHKGQLFGARANRRFQTADLVALIRGEVDAIFASGGRGVDFQALLGANVVFDMGTHPDLSVRVNNIVPLALTVSGGLVDERPDLVARYVATILVAARWASSHPSEMRRITGLEAGVAEEWIALAHPGVHEALEPSLAPDLLDAIESQKQFLHERGFIPVDFDLDAWLAPGPLEEAHRLVEAGFGRGWSRADEG